MRDGCLVVCVCVVCERGLCMVVWLCVCGVCERGLCMVVWL